MLQHHPLAPYFEHNVLHKAQWKRAAVNQRPACGALDSLAHCGQLVLGGYLAKGPAGFHRPEGAGAGGGAGGSSLSLQVQYQLPLP